MAGYDWSITLRIDTSFASANRSYPVMDPFHMGHAWITVAAPNGERVDFGYYPRNGGLAGPGELRTGDTTHQPRQDAAYTYHITPDQAAHVLAAAQHVQSDPGYYNGLTHNCLTVARDLMGVAGIAMPGVASDPLHILIGVGAAAVLDLPLVGAAGIAIAIAHDPAGFNTVLRSTPEGRAAEMLYNRSSELAGMRSTGDLHTMADHATQEALHSIGSEPHAELLHPAEDASAQAGASHAPDPQMSVDPGPLDWGGSSHVPDPAGMSVDPSSSEWGAMSHATDAGMSVDPSLYHSDETISTDPTFHGH